jgi:transcriptional antiterminator RfaH
MNWYVLYTKRKHEDMVAFLLENIGIEVLNFKLKERKLCGDNTVENTHPLFPCYLFAKFDQDKHSHLITYTRGVRYIVGKDNPIVVQDEIIRTLKENTDEGNTVVIKSRRFKKDEKVLITEGPFKDLCGIFEREIRGPERVMVLVQTLATLSCRVIVDSYCLAGL